MTGRLSPTEWQDYSIWPGPTHSEITWEDLKAAYRCYYEAVTNSADTLSEFLRIWTQRIPQRHHVQPKGDRPLPRKGETGPRPARQFDHRGRRRY